MDESFWCIGWSIFLRVFFFPQFTTTLEMELIQEWHLWWRVFFFFFNFMMFMLLWIIVYKVYWIRFFPSWLVVFHDHPLTCELLRIGNKKKRFMRECKDGAKIKQLGGNYKTYKHYILYKISIIMYFKKECLVCLIYYIFFIIYFWFF